MSDALNMVGLGSGLGSSYQAGTTPLLNPTDGTQIQTAYDQTQGGIAQQQAFVNALQGQNGIANQSNVFNQQQALTDQLQGVANGTGPNPAQAMLAQTTGANVANQAALMAGQRGAGANVGLLARQAAMQGANTQQQAAGQGATLQANQSLNALGQIGAQQANLANTAQTQVANQASALSGYNSAVQGQQSNILNAATGFNNSNVNLQNGINSADAGIAQGNAGRTASTIGSIAGGVASGGVSGAKAMGGMIEPMYAQGGAVPMYADGTPDAPVGMAPAALAPPQVAPTSGPKSAFARAMASLASQNQQQSSAKPSGEQQLGNTIGTGLRSGFQSIFGQGAPAAAPMNPNSGANDSALTDMMAASAPATGELTIPGGGTAMSDMIAGSNNGTGAIMDAEGGQTPDLMQLATKLAPMLLAKGGKVSAIVSPGEHIVPPKDVKKVAEGKKNGMDSKKVPGKAKVKGNSYANDTVPAKLQAGSIVLPRSVTGAKDPAQAAHAFVAAILAKQGKL